jgi:hypothetical protein
MTAGLISGIRTDTANQYLQTYNVPKGSPTESAVRRAALNVAPPSMAPGDGVPEYTQRVHAAAQDAIANPSKYMPQQAQSQGGSFSDMLSNILSPGQQNTSNGSINLTP